MAQGQPKPPPTASAQDQTGFRGQTNSQIGPFSQTLKNGAKGHPKREKVSCTRAIQVKGVVCLNNVADTSIPPASGSSWAGLRIGSLSSTKACSKVLEMTQNKRD